jgi:dienelactone hydrolase
MRLRRPILLLMTGVAVLILLAWAAAPYARAAALVVRAAQLGGAPERMARTYAYAVTTRARHAVATRHGAVDAQFYEPATGATRTVLLVPGIHAMGIDEPRLTRLARDLAGAGLRVMAMALPDLRRYRITPEATDVIEDAVRWAAAQPTLATDGRVGIVGISFAGGLAVSAAGRASIRDRVAFVVSFGGHGDLGRVMRYIATGDTPRVDGITVAPPHDYAASVMLYGLADRAVPDAQVAPLRDAIETFLFASQLTLVDRQEADETFARARALEATLPQPAATLMRAVNERDVAGMGAVIAPLLAGLPTDDPALSPQFAPPPAAPVYLLHGDGDTVIPTSESQLLGDALREKGVEVQVLLSGLITHAEVNRGAAAAETWKLVSFWRAVLER